MGKQEVIERLNNKLDEVFAFQRSFEPLTGAYMECESKASAYMTAINYVEQLDEPQKVKVKPFTADWFEEHKDFLELSLGRITPDIRTKIVQGQALSEFEKWFNNTLNEPFETIIRMKNGYEVEESKWVVNEGDLVIRKGEHEAKVYFVESVDDDGILLVNGIKDEFFTDLDERSVGEESINYFYENFRLLAKKENLEVEKVEV